MGFEETSRITKRCIVIVLYRRTDGMRFLHDVLVCVMEEARSSISCRGRQDNIQPHFERLPSMAHQDRIAVQRIQLLDTLEAVVDETSLGGQGVAGIDAFLDTTSLVVILESQAVCPLVRLDHPVLAVPYLRPGRVRVHRAVGHGAVQVVGEGELHVVLGGGRVLVKIVRRVGPGNTRLACGDSVADGVIGVGVAVGCIHIGRSTRQFGAVVVGVGDDVRSGVRTSRAGDGCAPPDGIVHIAVSGDSPVLNLSDEIAVLFVGPGGGDSVGAGHLGDEITVRKSRVVEAAQRDGDLVHATILVVAICIVRDVVDGQPLPLPLEPRACVGARERLVVHSRDGLGDLVQRGVVRESARPNHVRHLRQLAEAIIGIGDVGSGVGVVDARQLPEEVVAVGGHQIIVLRVLPCPCS